MRGAGHKTINKEHNWGEVTSLFLISYDIPGGGGFGKLYGLGGSVIQ